MTIRFSRRSALTSIGAGAVLGFSGQVFGSSDLRGADQLQGVNQPLPLDDKSIGHIRHFSHLANLPPGEWAGMGEGARGWEAIPEGSIRYQLAFMAYALASVQVNRTPAYRDIYRDTILALFGRLSEWSNWRDWTNVSREGPMQNPASKTLNIGWIDPLKKHNAMFAGHVMHMAALYDSLYGEERFLGKDSIILRFPENNWGFGPQEFKYDIPTLASVLFEQFRELDFEGFPCEPTLTFPQCPQHAVLGISLSDALTGSNYGPQLKSAYLAAWKRMNYVDPVTGSLKGAMRRKPNFEWLGNGPDVETDGWTFTFMHAWARDYVRSLYEQQRDRHLPNLLDRRRTGVPQRVIEGSTGIGFLAAYATEVGDVPTAQALLDFADNKLSPVWTEGRYFYPRNDSFNIDDQGAFRLNSTFQGNAILALARLNVGDGLWRLHNDNWFLRKRAEPYIAKVDYTVAGVSEAVFNRSTQQLVVALLPGPLAASISSFEVRNLAPEKPVSLFRNGVPGDAIPVDANGIARIQFDPRKPCRLTVSTESAAID